MASLYLPYRILIQGTTMETKGNRMINAGISYASLYFTLQKRHEDNDVPTSCPLLSGQGKAVGWLRVGMGGFGKDG